MPSLHTEMMAAAPRLGGRWHAPRVGPWPQLSHMADTVLVLEADGGSHVSPLGSLGKSLFSSVPQFIHLLNGYDETPGKSCVHVIFIICVSTSLAPNGLLTCSLFANG